jgi:hypothetical protein
MQRMLQCSGGFGLEPLDAIVVRTRSGVALFATQHERSTEKHGGEIEWVTTSIVSVVYRYATAGAVQTSVSFLDRRKAPRIR